MKLDASPETVAAVAQVLKLAGYLDDRVGQPDKGRIIAWAEQVQRHQLAEDDLLAGLQAYYDGPHDHAIVVGDLIAHAKTARQIRTQTEAQKSIAAQAARGDAKAAADEPRSIAAVAMSSPVDNETPRLQQARTGLRTCHGKHESITAIREYFAAKKDAQKPQNARIGTTTPITTR